MVWRWKLSLMRVGNKNLVYIINFIYICMKFTFVETGCVFLSKGKKFFLSLMNLKKNLTLEMT